MNFNSTCRLGAIFKLVVKKGGTDEVVRETPEFHNLVLDSGLKRMNEGTWISGCSVGTGTSTPIVSQTSLDTFKARTTHLLDSSISGIQIDIEPYYYFAKSTWRFETGAVVGEITEVGLDWSNNNLWNRALIKDVLGNPTSLTVAADEYLDVKAEVRVYPSNSAGTFNVEDPQGNILSTHTYTTSWRYLVSQYEGAYWGAGLLNLGNPNGINGFGISSYTVPQNLTDAIPGINKYHLTSSEITRNLDNNSFTVNKIIKSDEANINHASLLIPICGLMTWTYEYSYKEIGFRVGIDPPIVKTSDDILTYSITISWDRYTPE